MLILEDLRPFFVKVEMEEIEPEQIIKTAKPLIPDGTSPVLPSSEEPGPVLQVLPTDGEVLGQVERRMLEALAGRRILTVTELYSKPRNQPDETVFAKQWNSERNSSVSGSKGPTWLTGLVASHPQQGIEPFLN